MKKTYLVTSLIVSVVVFLVTSTFDLQFAIMLAAEAFVISMI